MKRSLVFLLAIVLVAQTSLAGELRTGRGGVRHFQVASPEGERAKPKSRYVYRMASTRSNWQEGVEAEPNPASGAEAPLQPLTNTTDEPVVAPLSEGTEWLDEAVPAGPCNCGACTECGNYWFDADFLMWWRRAQAPPVLASTNFLPNGQILFGGENIGNDMRVGARFEAGGYLNYDHVRSVEGRFWALGKSRSTFDSNDLNPTVSVLRPFIDVEPGSPTFNQEIGLPINNIGGSVGSMQVALEANVWGGDLLFRHQFHQGHGARGDILFGYHGSRIDEDIVIEQNFTNQGVDFYGRDVFNTKNDFHGLVLGVQVVSRQGPWTIDVLGKVAMGDVHQRVNISGFETRDDGVTVETTPGSLLALPTNIGYRERNKFAVMPEVALETRWQCLENVELSLGYTYLFWSDVMQAGETIDRTINGSQTSGGTLNGVARPGFIFQDGTYWVHGVNFGLTWTY